MPQLENLTTVDQDNLTNNHHTVNKNQDRVITNSDSTVIENSDIVQWMHELGDDDDVIDENRRRSLRNRVPPKRYGYHVLRYRYNGGPSFPLQST